MLKMAYHQLIFKNKRDFSGERGRWPGLSQSHREERSGHAIQREHSDLSDWRVTWTHQRGGGRQSRKGQGQAAEGCGRLAESGLHHPGQESGCTWTAGARAGMSAGTRDCGVWSLSRGQRWHRSKDRLLGGGCESCSVPTRSPHSSPTNPIQTTSR